MLASNFYFLNTTQSLCVSCNVKFSFPVLKVIVKQYGSFSIRMLDYLAMQKIYTIEAASEIICWTVNVLLPMGYTNCVSFKFFYNAENILNALSCK